MSVRPDPTLEYYPTPDAFTRWLYDEMSARGARLGGFLLEPCVGDGAIVRALDRGITADFHLPNWVTNDLDHHWLADQHADATNAAYWRSLGLADWVVTNPPFSAAIEIAEQALAHVKRGVVMHLRASIHEVLKTGPRRTWMSEHPPTGILWLPRFAYQRSKKYGTWATDNVCACWVVWLRGVQNRQFIAYAPEWVLDALEAETPAYRARMDEFMGFTGSESERQAQCIARWKEAA